MPPSAWGTSHTNLFPTERPKKKILNFIACQLILQKKKEITITTAAAAAVTTTITTTTSTNSNTTANKVILECQIPSKSTII